MAVDKYPQPTADSRRPKADSGFTLVELVAVLVIVAILAGVTAAAINSLGDSRAAAAARHLLADITYARQRAVATGVNCWVVFDQSGGPGGWTILIENIDNPGRANATVINDMATGRPHEIDLAANYRQVSLTSVNFDGESRVGFDWLGQPLTDDNTPLVQVATVAFSGNHSVTVQPGTGYAAHIAP